MILVVDYFPRMTSGARLYQELAESFIEMGQEVTIVTEYPTEENILVEGTSSVDDLLDRINDVRIRRVSALSFMSKFPGGKALRYLFSCFLFIIKGLLTGKQDIILVYSPPLFLGYAGHILGWLKVIRFVFDLQDIHPKVLFDSGVIRNEFIKKMLTKMEGVSYKNAKSMIVYSRGNQEYVLDHGVKGEVHIIPNWIDDAMMSNPERTHSVIPAYADENQIVVTYAGTMQEAQGIEIVTTTAELLRDHNEIVFLLAGDGSSKKPMQEFIDAKGLKNIKLLPVIPREQYVKFLYESDICLLPLGKETPMQTVPGKLADLMVSGNPILAVVNLAGDAAGVLNKAGCGVCVAPGDTNAFAQAVIHLASDPELRQSLGEKGRLYAEEHFSRASCTQQYLKVLTAAR